ncbi:MAG TPA: polysaccharide biosynthesis tyrosine autokinase [Opitutaceae bacterium]|nr:polysaccharide biosynthesis tyrosine autokinase [Opitutaceae bacterium]
MAKTNKAVSYSKRAEAPAAAKGFSGISPRALLNMFLERWWIGLIVALLAGGAFILFQPRHDPIYYTEVQLLFEPKEKKVLNITEVVDTTTSSALDLHTHLARMKSDTFLDYVLQSFSPKEAELIQAAYRDPDNPNAAPMSLRAIIRPSIQLREEKATTIVHIGSMHRDPEAAALIANRFARKYIDFMLDEAMTGTNSAILWLRNQAEEKHAELESATRAMQDFREKHSMASLGEARSVVASTVTQLGQQLVTAQMDQNSLKAILDTIEQFQKAGKDLTELPQIASVNGISGLRTDLQNLKAQRVMLADRYLEDHPKMKENEMAIAGVQDRLKTNIELAIGEYKTRYAFAIEQEKRARQQFADMERRLQELDRTTDQYKFLEDDYNFKNRSLNSIQQRLQEATIVSQLENVNIRVLDRANVPTIPVNGTPKQVALQAGAIAFVLLFGIPLGLGFLDSRVKSPHDVESGLEQILLGGIKTMKKLSETERPNVFRLGKDDSLSEAYRGIFSEIEIRSVVPFPKRLLVTSSVPSEGKSLTASNLAAVFAAHGRKTLLVDCDFRRPTLRRYFGATAGIGLLPWLRENSHRSDVQVDTHKMGIMNIGPAFDLLPAGDAIKNPTEVIDQIASCDLFNKLSKHYDLIVIDTPPSSVFPDALLLSRFCSELVYVCRFKTVRKAMIKKTLTKFTDSGVHVLGVVLNCVPSSSVMNYGYDGYGSYGSEYYRSYQTEKVTT